MYNTLHNIIQKQLQRFSYADFIFDIDNRLKLFDEKILDKFCKYLILEQLCNTFNENVVEIILMYFEFDKRKAWLITNREATLMQMNMKIGSMKSQHLITNVEYVCKEVVNKATKSRISFGEVCFLWVWMIWGIPMIYIIYKGIKQLLIT